MFMMMNRVLGTNTNKSNRNKNKLHEIKNGNTLCKTPNTRPPKKVPTSKDFKKSADFSTSSKLWVLRSFQINHIKQAGTIF